MIGAQAPAIPVVEVAFNDAMVIVPFVDGMLRPETMAAVESCGAGYLTQPIATADAGDYARAFRDWWDLPMDIVIVEQDIVPTRAQLVELIDHPDEWVSAPYHVGEGRYTTGLGFCKIAASLRERWPDGATNITADPRGRGGYVSWQSLNEAVERHLGRLGERMTVLGAPVIHLHYPLGASDG